MNLISNFPPLIFNWKKGLKTTKSRKEKTSTLKETSNVNSKIMSDEAFFRLIDSVKKSHKEKMLSHADEGLSDGAENIPAWDSDKKCQNEQAFNELNEIIKSKLNKEYVLKQTILKGSITEFQKELDYIDKTGLDKYHWALSEEKGEALNKIEWIKEIIYVFGMKFILAPEKVKVLLAKMDRKIKNLKKEKKNVTKAYLKNFVDQYNSNIPSPRDIIDDNRFWWAFAALFGVEILISFKSIQFFGQSSNIASFFLATILALTAAKIVHDCGAYLYNLLTQGKDKGRFYATLIISLGICALLSGFRLNMEGGSFVLLVINLLFTTIAGYLSFLRAEHSQHFTLKRKMEKLSVEIDAKLAERKDIEKDYNNRVEKINNDFLQKAKERKESDVKELQQRKDESEFKIQHLQAKWKADLQDIENVKAESMMRYREYNRTSRTGIHPPVKRWEEPPQKISVKENK